MYRKVFPKFKDDHLLRLTDDVGILQHAKFGVPDPSKGYTTDDNARALIVAVKLYARYRAPKYLDLMFRYLAFLIGAQNGRGRFKNFMGFDRRFLEEEGSDDCFGRCLWALGTVIAGSGIPAGAKNACRDLLKSACPNVLNLKSPRAKAYSIIGLCLADAKETRELVFESAESLSRQYEETRDGDWRWFENSLTYGNAVLPWSLFAAAKLLANERFLNVALESLSFLEDITFRNGYFKPVGCNGWFIKGERPAEYDEQPLEAGETTLAFLEAYAVTGDRRYLGRARISHAWYEGNNSKGISLIDRETWGCFDGITEDGVNLNQGAESLISYCLSFLALHER